jgi:hypothetical protein
MTAALHAYELEIEPARQRVKGREELRELISPTVERDRLHAFLIQWASLSVQLQEPLELFLAEASRRCASHGETKLALELLHIALEAIEIYRMLADDARALAQLWNGRRLPHLDMTSLLTQPVTPAIRRIHEHDRQLVLGADPWAQLASAFEIYTLLASMADRTLAHATGLLGEEARAGLRSLNTLAQRHASSTMTRAMGTFLTGNPERLEVMVAAGTQTLEHYGEFLAECSVAGFNLSSWQARQLA